MIKDFRSFADGVGRYLRFWLHIAHVKYREQIVEESQETPAAFIGQLAGQNFSKLLVQMSPHDNGSGDQSGFFGVHR